MATINCYLKTGSGHIYPSDNTSWDTVHDGSAVTAENNAHSAAYKSGSIYSLVRVFLPFDTSTIPAGATVTGVSLYLYCNSVEANADVTRTDVVQTTQASDTSLVVGDYQNIGTTVAGYKNIADQSAGNWYAIDLGATGISWINKTGTTKLGLRNSRDTTDSAPTGINSIYYDYRGETNPPYLAITYTITGGNFLVFF
jgi:hypothetical protein